MNILFWTLVNEEDLSNPKTCSDYQIQALLHGFRQMSTVRVVDFPKLQPLYKDYPEEKRQKVWGKFFTLYGFLDDNVDLQIKRQQFDIQLKYSYFDKIIVPVHNTQQNNHQELNRRIEQLLNLGYKKQDIAVIDGHDKPSIHEEIANKTTYFKRELNDKYKDLCYPIWFAIPEEKITTPLPRKRDISEIVPAKFVWNGCPHLNNYFPYDYGQEQEYYRQYQESYLAYTIVKGGCDTIRLLEIIACGCLPLFLDIDRVPEYTLYNHHKELYKEILNLKGIVYGWNDKFNTFNPIGKHDTREIQAVPNHGYIKRDKIDWELYMDYQYSLMRWIRNQGTTKYLAQYVLDICKN